MLTIVQGTPAHMLASMGTQNLTNLPATSVVAGLPYWIEAGRPVGATMIMMRTPVAVPDMHIIPAIVPVIVPGPGISPPGMGVPTCMTVLGMLGPVATIKDPHMTIPFAVFGVASGVTGAPGMIV